MGHHQPPTRLSTDNSTAQGFVNSTIKQKRSRTFDRQYWWLKDWEAQLQFSTIWEPGCFNLADYYTKHHMPSHHKRVRPIYLYEGDRSPTTLQGCNRILTQRLTRGQTPVNGQTKALSALQPQDHATSVTDSSMTSESSKGTHNSPTNRVMNGVMQRKSLSHSIAELSVNSSNISNSNNSYK